MIHVTYERADNQRREDRPSTATDNTAVYRELRDSNQLSKYWLIESPEVLETEKNVIRYYPKHGKLAVHLPDYCTRDCQTHIGKGVGLNLDALQDEPDVLHRLIEILQQIEKGGQI